ncbi:DUF599 domain-containing protein [Leeia sp. TBRC 13508]|uniref:DUF599 domain-containing protein n=1 Tax=Leeia speluncae TaxID=2884804 RepID=A0ABS8D9M3_9NEIS|nr:DUF599 domain-containing protein [Leeia speluncae]MCB6184723.1 DUF599 domain-containing protein [Leeia speluncae]
MHAMQSSFGWLDGLAIIWFILLWVGYSWYTDRGVSAKTGLVVASHQHRVFWAKSILSRGLQVADAVLVGNLMSSVSFYASTTIYVLAGLLALMGTVDKVILFASSFSYYQGTSREVWEFKLLLLVVVFVIAYFKFTWSLRQFNFLSILLGAAPSTSEDHAVYADRLAKLNTYAGDEFNRGIRAYYFGLAAIAWFIQPLAFIVASTLVVIILYRRDFASEALDAMQSH